MKRLCSLVALCACAAALCGPALTVNAAAETPGDQYWEAVPGVPAIDGEIYAMAWYNGLLVVGGTFTIACDPVATNVAGWNGTTWVPLGTGVNGTVHALTVFNSMLIAGGAFTNAGGTAANYIASWNGSAWSALPCYAGYPPGQIVKALASYNGKLAAGTDYTIYAWTGYVWEILGNLESYNSMRQLCALAVYDTRLIAGGTFTVYGTDAHCVAAWDGYSWASTGFNGSFVYTLAVYDYKLIVGGFFGLLDTWDGLTWSSIAPPSGDFFQVRCLTLYRDNLIAAGQTQEGGFNNIASWDGSAWSTLGSGTDNVVYALSISWIEGIDRLAVGGTFDTAGAKASHTFALWNPSMPTPASIEAGRALLHQNYPNPFNPVTQISFDLKEPANISLKIYDAAGRLVRELAAGDFAAGRHRAIWDGRDASGAAVSSGIYFYRLEAGTFSQTRKMVLLR